MATNNFIIRYHNGKTFGICQVVSKQGSCCQSRTYSRVVLRLTLLDKLANCNLIEFTDIFSFGMHVQMTTCPFSSHPFDHSSHWNALVLTELVQSALRQYQALECIHESTLNAVIACLFSI